MSGQRLRIFTFVIILSKRRAIYICDIYVCIYTEPKAKKFQFSIRILCNRKLMRADLQRHADFKSFARWQANYSNNGNKVSSSSSKIDSEKKGKETKKYGDRITSNDFCHFFALIIPLWLTQRRRLGPDGGVDKAVKVTLLRIISVDHDLFGNWLPKTAAAHFWCGNFRENMLFTKSDNIHQYYRLTTSSLKHSWYAAIRECWKHFFSRPPQKKMRLKKCCQNILSHTICIVPCGGIYYVDVMVEFKEKNNILFTMIRLTLKKLWPETTRNNNYWWPSKLIPLSNPIEASSRRCCLFLSYMLSGHLARPSICT